MNCPRNCRRRWLQVAEPSCRSWFLPSWQYPMKRLHRRRPTSLSYQRNRLVVRLEAEPPRSLRRHRRQIPSFRSARRKRLHRLPSQRRSSTEVFPKPEHCFDLPLPTARSSRHWQIDQNSVVLETVMWPSWPARLLPSCRHLDRLPPVHRRQLVLPSCRRQAEVPNLIRRHQGWYHVEGVCPPTNCCRHRPPHQEVPILSSFPDDSVPFAVTRC